MVVCSIFRGSIKFDTEVPAQTNGGGGLEVTTGCATREGEPSGQGFLIPAIPAKGYCLGAQRLPAALMGSRPPKGGSWAEGAVCHPLFPVGFESPDRSSGGAAGRMVTRNCWSVLRRPWSNGMSPSRSKCGPFFRLVWWSPNGHLQHIPGIESARHGSSCSDYEW